MDSKNDKVILVIGGTGRTGSRLVKQLIAEGYTVRLIVRNREKAK